MEYLVTYKKKDGTPGISAYSLQAETPEELGVKIQELCEKRGLDLIDVGELKMKKISN